jgi:hypothetical protein
VTVPLGDLDAVDWLSLSHAYGPAKTTADELRALTSEDEGTRSEAFGALTASICHQGSVYPATGAAVPFLVEIATMESVPAGSRAEVVMLLDWIAEGNVDLGRRWPESATEQWVQTLGRNLRQATPRLLELVRGPDPALVRAWAVWTIHSLPATSEDLHELRTTVVVERDALVKATIALALDPTDPVLRELVSPDVDPLVRLCAAAQLIPITADLESLVEVARECAPQSARFRDLPIVQEDTDCIRLIALKLGMVSPDEQVRWIGLWLDDRSLSVHALYAAAGAGATRRSAALRLIEPVTRVVEHPPADDPEIRQAAAFALGELGLPGLERIGELASSLTGGAREMVEIYRIGADNQKTAYAPPLRLDVALQSRPPAELAGLIAAAGSSGSWEWDGVRALDQLASWGPQAIDQTGVVEQALNDPKSSLMRIHAAWALARITGDAARSVAVLMREFEPGPVGWHAAEILGEIGPQASPALPMLREYVGRDLRPPDVPAMQDDLLVAACVDAIVQIGKA